jgi:hypothetical protein
VQTERRAGPIAFVDAAAGTNPGTMGNRALAGQRHFRLFCHSFKHDARASEFRRKLLTRLRFVLVWPTKVALCN